MSSMYAGYNKDDADGALVGNWVEEDALRATTGFSRRKIPLPASCPDSKQSRIEPTHARVVAHSDAEQPAHYTSTSHASQRYDESVLAKPTIKPRSSTREAAMLQQARAIEEEKALRLRQEDHKMTTLHSNSRESYQPIDNAHLMSIHRVPRGRNGARVIDETVRDLTRAQVDSLDRMKLELLQQTSTHPQGVAVTTYSHAIVTGKGLNFAVSGSDGANPFGRSTAFTNDIRDPIKRHGEAMVPGSQFDLRNGLSVHQRSALNKFQAFVKEPDTCAQAQLLFERLSEKAEEDYIQLREFQRIVVETGGGFLTDKEAIQVFMCFDYENIGAICLQDLRARLQM